MCKSDVFRREIKPDAMMTRLIELYKKVVVSVVKDEDEEDEDEDEERKRKRSMPYMSQLPTMTQSTTS